MAGTTCELKWISYLFRDFQLHLQTPIPLYYDNKAAIAIAASPIDHERTKHIDIDCHLIREHVEKGFISTPRPGPHIFGALGKIMYEVNKLSPFNKK